MGVMKMAELVRKYENIVRKRKGFFFIIGWISNKFN